MGRWMGQRQMVKKKQGEERFLATLEMTWWVAGSSWGKSAGDCRLMGRRAGIERERRDKLKLSTELIRALPRRMGKIVRDRVLLPALLAISFLGENAAYAQTTFPAPMQEGKREVPGFPAEPTAGRPDQHRRGKRQRASPASTEGGET